jgi:hypothetical protein
MTEDRKLKAPAGSAGPPSKGRRTLLVGGMLGVGISTLPFRPVLANTCTVSGAQSVNPSQPTVTCQGRSHGYYKTQTSDWPGGYKRTTLYSSVFGSGRASPSTLTFLDALNGSGTCLGAGNHITMAQAVAAVLNAASYSATTFGYDVPGIVAYINDNWNDPNLTSNLDLLNRRS